MTNGPELLDVATGGTVWVGLSYLIVRSVVAIFGTRAERAREKSWTQLNERLQELAGIYDRQLERLTDIMARDQG